jgi:flagellar basal-body rod modification protein FlgD
VTLSFVDASGKTVHSESLGAQTAGDFSFAWDGKDDSGNAVTGPVTVQASAKGTAGTITPTLSTWADVTGVQSPAGGTDAKLITGLGLIAPTDALSLA